MRKHSVQFFGLPGSGKTSTLRALLANFPDVYRAIPKFSTGERLRLSLLFVLRFPSIGARFFFLLVQNPPRLWRYIAHLVSQSFAAHMYVSLHADAKQLFLIDEGIAQRLLSVAPGTFSRSRAERLVRMMEGLASPVVVMSGGNFSRFVLEPDRMMSSRHALGEAYYKTWSENLMYNFKLLSEVARHRGVTYEGVDLEALHQSIQS